MERKISSGERGKGQKGSSGCRGCRLPPCAVPHCFPRVLERRSSSRAIQREGPTAHLDLHHAVSQLTKKKFSAAGRRAGQGPCSERALLRSAFMQKGKLAVLQDACSH